MFFVFFKIVINNSLKNRRPKSNFVIFYCMHCKKMENFYNTYNLNGGKGEKEGRRLFKRQWPSFLWYQWPSFTTPAIGNFLKSIAGVVNNGH